MTADEFLALPGEQRWTQLIEGEVVVNEPDIPHQFPLGEIHGELRNWVRAAPGRGFVSLPLDVKIDDRNVFGPDLLWYAERPGKDRAPYPVPDLVVEVRSPNTWRYDTGIKRTKYDGAGLPELWLVDTVAQEVRIVRRGEPDAVLGAGDTLTSPQLPGFGLPVEAIFEN